MVQTCSIQGSNQKPKTAEIAQLKTIKAREKQVRKEKLDNFLDYYMGLIIGTPVAAAGIAGAYLSLKFDLANSPAINHGCRIDSEIVGAIANVFLGLGAGATAMNTALFTLILLSTGISKLLHKKETRVEGKERED